MAHWWRCSTGRARSASRVSDAIVVPFDAAAVLIALWLWLGVGIVAFGVVAALLALWAVLRGKNAPPR